MPRLCGFRALRALILVVATALVAGAAWPQNGAAPKQKYVYHYEWMKGAHVTAAEWAGGRAINYRDLHLPPPRRGYQWREIDGNYVLAANSGHVIEKVIAAPH